MYKKGRVPPPAAAFLPPRRLFLCTKFPNWMMMTLFRWYFIQIQCSKTSAAADGGEGAVKVTISARDSIFQSACM